MQEQTIAVVLSGCGALDGSEVHEATLTLLALELAGVRYQCLAPNILQTRVSNMVTGKTIDSQRNVLEESARIARGKIKDIAKVNPADYTAMIFPGGYGAALNLCNFGLDKKNYTVQADVLKFSKAIVNAKKPAGFICIAPVLVPKLYPSGVTITIGNDKETAQILESLGAKPIACESTKCVVDTTHKVVSTPAYILAHSIKDVATGIECLVKELLVLLKS
ncbi:MAG: isoprenoid biosynthesis glyoxalase ElbB [Pseudomonadota bacterium]